MLLMLLPEQLDKYWPLLKYVIENTFPRNVVVSSTLMNNILEALLNGSMQAWIYVIGEDTIVASLITSIYKDPVIKTKGLKIYCLYSFEPLSKENWVSGANTLYKFAKSEECDLLEGYSTNEAIIKQGKEFNWSIETRLYKEI